MTGTSLRYLMDAKRPLVSGDGWDVFVSAYNNSSRVQATFEKVSAASKYWWMLPEYGYEPAEFPVGCNVVPLNSLRESELIATGCGASGISTHSSKRICIDITGFMRPHILFFLQYFKSKGIRSLDFIYTEPKHYSRKADTRFTLADVREVRQVDGFIGQHSSEMSNDVLILGVGYDDDLMARVILTKESAKLIQLHSFPSLSADMYHESILRLSRVSSVSHRVPQDQLLFSSANDPFVTATVLSETVSALNQKSPVTNLYLSPLATKPQALGFGLYFVSELKNTSASILFPFSDRYSRETASGEGRAWVYPISL